MNCSVPRDFLKNCPLIRTRSGGNSQILLVWKQIKPAVFVSSKLGRFADRLLVIAAIVELDQAGKFEAGEKRRAVSEPCPAAIDDACRPGLNGTVRRSRPSGLGDRRGDTGPTPAPQQGMDPGVVGAGA